MKYLLSISLFFSLASQAQFTLDDFKGLDRIAAVHGWEMKTKKGSLAETWKKENDSLFTSTSYRITGKDSVLEETVDLSFSNGSICYAPLVTGQNGGRRVRFLLVSVDANRMNYVFENREHDFPQKIVYQLGGKTLRVTISGNTEEGFREIHFPFVMR